MTKKEREYLQAQIKNNNLVIKKVEKGEQWADIYTTKELKEAFIQGLNYANEVFDAFING